MSDSDPLDRVETWDAHGNPYWNGVSKPAKEAPGVGKLHRARIEDGRVVEVECYARVESWIAFTADSVPQKDRRTCSNCGDLSRVPGVEKETYWSVELTEDYDPERWSPKPLTDGGRVVDDTERPAEWPVTFPDPDLDCNHQYHWDDADGLYRCVYCDVERERPPERWMDADAERDGGESR